MLNVLKLASEPNLGSDVWRTEMTGDAVWGRWREKDQHHFNKFSWFIIILWIMSYIASNMQAQLTWFGFGEHGRGCGGGSSPVGAQVSGGGSGRRWSSAEHPPQHGQGVGEEGGGLHGWCRSSGVYPSGSFWRTSGLTTVAIGENTVAQRVSDWCASVKQSSHHNNKDNSVQCAM